MNPVKIRWWFYRNTPVVRIANYLKKITLPGFGGIPVYYVLGFFFKGIQEGYIPSRAASIAFSLFLALFPALIFLFSLIPYIPIDDFQESIIMELVYLAPEAFNGFLENTILDVVENKHGNVLSIGVIMALYFATNGINAMLNAFNMTYFELNMRSWISQQLISIWITLIITLFVITAILMILFGSAISQIVLDDFLGLNQLEIILINIGRWIVSVAFVYFSIAIIYYYAPKKENEADRRRFLSPGATLATLFVILFTMVFALYLKNFNSYNKLYGSIGTVMGLMILIYLNCIAIIIGFELNAAIKWTRRSSEILKFKLTI